MCNEIADAEIRGESLRPAAGQLVQHNPAHPGRGATAVDAQPVARPACQARRPSLHCMGSSGLQRAFAPGLPSAMRALITTPARSSAPLDGPLSSYPPPVNIDSAGFSIAGRTTPVIRILTRHEKL